MSSGVLLFYENYSLFYVPWIVYWHNFNWIVYWHNFSDLVYCTDILLLVFVFWIFGFVVLL